MRKLALFVLDDEHLRGHIKDHPKDAEFLNVPIENYTPMQVIFGAGQATSRYGMGSNEPLGTPSNLIDTYMTPEGVTKDSAAGSVGVTGGSGDGCGHTAATAASVNGNGSIPGPATASQGAKGSGSDEPVNPGKRRRSLNEEEVSIMTGLTGAVHKIAEAFEAPIVVQTSEVHPQLYTACMGTIGFIEEDLMTALNFLLDNKRQGDGFVAMTENHHVLWMRQFLARLAAQAHSYNE
ncbi:hypothetical protein QOZ80_6BG0479510 [Eleusine coracana subsp. coracana]|nr:hypothetical protein QOZ80_6BG0479510 [Eleusine coracana subsp. coracana]